MLITIKIDWPSLINTRLFVWPLDPGEGNREMAEKEALDAQGSEQGNV